MYKIQGQRVILQQRTEQNVREKSVSDFNVVKNYHGGYNTLDIRLSIC